jgi:hypothetical protein
MSIAMACLATLVGLPTSATATHQDLSDDRDVKGRFDVRRVEMWGPHSNSGFQIETFRKWRPRIVWDAGFFIVNVDSFGKPRFDYYVMVRSTGRKMQGLLFRDRETKRDFVMRTVRVWRPNSRSVKFRFPWRAVRFPDTRRFFRWNAQSLYTNDFCPNVCIDNVPDNGTIVTTVRSS